MSDFNLLFENYIESYIFENTGINTVGIFPGAFKPPHMGHFITALEACRSCDQVYIFVSQKDRPLVQDNRGKSSMPDSNRYDGIEKYTGNLLDVSRADVARATSASVVRKAIADQDVKTIRLNLPNEVGEDGKDQILQILLDNNGSITGDHALRIWEVYKPALVSNSNIDIDNINISISVPSPVKDTYDLVSSLNDSDIAGQTAIKLYVGS